MPIDLADPIDMDLSAEWLGLASASEQLFFAAMPVAHVVAYDDHQREQRLARGQALALRSGLAAGYRPRR